MQGGTQGRGARAGHEGYAILKCLSLILSFSIDHLELYIKVRLNSRPSYQRQRRFDRGPVAHKTRVLRGSSNPQWREDFMVNEAGGSLLKFSPIVG